MERRHDEAGQAQQKEMQRPRSAAAAEIHEQPDGEIHRSHRVLVKHRGVAVRLGDADRVNDFHGRIALVQHRVLSAAPRSQAGLDFGGVDGALDFDALDRNQLVAQVQTRFGARARAIARITTVPS